MSTLRVSDAVCEALADGRPVVALESAVFPAFPGEAGLDLVRLSQDLVRKQGAVPATIAVAAGQVRIGLSEAEEAEFADMGPSVEKIGARDVSSCLVRRTYGATTIGATLAVARLAGIRFAAASGLGGVHRGYSERLDISADIGELASSRLLVVTGGVKSFLDVRATAEVLETLSVPMLGWRTDSLPLYFSGVGGPEVSARLETAAEVAQVAWHHWNTLQRHGGILLGRPPREDLTDVQELIAGALDRAEIEGVTGPGITAHVLGEVHRLSGGRTKNATKQLILDTAELAGEIAVAYAAVEGQQQ
ncbi:pseudouridine-5'-phosphate glycosidase [Nocardioides endophyticus]|uniref:Pseudouridine-5'-phosphate glycosidase n=1 Tax=Nocardioides endophyticus TaxID=1353775 RepID=A0ABP8YY27_9ACTN